MGSEEKTIVLRRNYRKRSPKFLEGASEHIFAACSIFCSSVGVESSDVSSALEVVDLLQDGSKLVLG